MNTAGTGPIGEGSTTFSNGHSACGVLSHYIWFDRLGLPALEAAPIVPREQPDGGNASSAGGDTLRGIAGRHAPQRKHRDALGRGASLAEPFEALGLV